MPAPPRDTSHGFTLLEVLVACVIAVPALVLLFGQGATAIGSARASGLYQQAISRAKSRLETLAGPNLQPGERAGEDGEGFRWHTRIVPLDTLAPPASAPRGTLYQDGTTLFGLTVELSWSQGAGSQGPGDRHVTLQSRRLGPATPGSAP